MSIGTKVYKTWGHYQVLDVHQISEHLDITALTKRIHLNPHSRFSYQLHNNRDELWTVISGYGILVLDDQQYMCLPDTQIRIPRRTKHTFITFDTPTTIIEVQTGYPDEDDIERFPDFEPRLAPEYQGLAGGIKKLEETQKSPASADLPSRVIEVIADKLDLSIYELKPDTMLADLGCDSLDTVEIVVELEKTFDISIPDEDVDDLNTVGDIITYITRRTNSIIPA